MSGLARRIAPAAALGGLAIVAVGVLDPALAGIGTTASDAATPVAASTTTATDGGAPTSSSGAATDSPTDSCSAGTEATGEAVMTPWGPVQVVATVADGQLCEVHAIAYPVNDHHSQQINAAAIPVLDEAATQSGVEFDAVSGATYTSEAYRESLQSILDSA